MSDLFTGYGDQIITPPLGTDLCGYGFNLDRKGERVLDDLKVRTLFLEKGTDRLIFISCDLLGLTVDVTDEIRHRISREFDIAFENVLLSCIHTHSGPMSLPMKSIGKEEPDYLPKVSDAIIESVKQAFDDRRKSELFSRIELVEPIGYNRKTKSFSPIDSALKVLICRRKSNTVYFMSYACHPVVLGITKDISADWPGALIGEIEKKGHHGIFFQGFCGDINPVTYMSSDDKINRPGKLEDLSYYGCMLSRRVFKAEQYAEPLPVTSLKAAEKRINLPLQVPSPEEIKKETRKLQTKHSSNKPFLKFMDEWSEDAKKVCIEMQKKPYQENVPVQAIALGDLKILGLPGEVFCEIGLKLREERPLLFTLGLSGGNIGYLPTEIAYQSEFDYACYQAPKYYHYFPFTPELEKVIVNTSEEILASLDE